MTYQIARPLLDGISVESFDARVTTYAEELKIWRTHMAKVTEAKPQPVLKSFDGQTDAETAFAAAFGDWEKSEATRFIPYPRPTEAELVMNALGEDGNPNYQVVDSSDDSEVNRVFKQERVLFVDQIQVAEREALEKILPLNKRRLWEIKKSDVLTADNQRRSDLVIAFTLSQRKSMKNMEEKEKDAWDFMDSLDQQVIDGRPSKDQEFMDQYTEIQNKMATVERKAAEIQADVEDLTPEAQASWTLPSLEN